MSLESEPVEEPKDRTLLVWGGIVLAVLLMLGVLWITSNRQATISRVHTSHILVQFNPSDMNDRKRAMELIQELRQRVLDGESFSKLAREYSNDPVSAPRGGDLGWMKQGVLDPAIDAFAWSAPVNTISEPIITSYGVHLVLVNDRILSGADQYEQDLRERTFGEDGPDETTPEDGEE